MKELFADRMSNVPRSFVREILRVTEDPDIISFAGGLPNPISFPYKEIAESAAVVFKDSSNEALQYGSTEGYKPLRDYIAKRYQNSGLDISPDNILMINGSQQGLDLIGKVFLNRDDVILIERPTYLAAIQSFGLYEPKFVSIPLLEDGIDLEVLEDMVESFNPKLFYSIPNFQNPTGITYSKNKREKIGDIFNENNTILVEDNPYGEIRFIGEDLPPIKSYIENSVLLGSFSKIVSPGMRLGWIVADKEIMNHLITAKQASDLHSNYLTQMIVHQYLSGYDVEAHIQNIRNMYRIQRDCMVKMIKKYFPSDVKYTKPEGGMFLWVTLPESMSSMELFEIAINENVAFVPGEAFYSNNPETNTLRLNFSNSDERKIEEGIKRLGHAIKYLKQIE
ncbi:MAG: PLP-dependent aminotransferase family protein [Methanobacterium sp.]|uniref:aminotransferase-like domain-containing protein n=1 Tax=Methanobacterium sp. TaxID=2164 RepID=UPI003C729DBB